MKRLIGYSLIIIALVVSLAKVTGYDYLGTAVRQSYFRGWKNANIDDLRFKVDARTVPASAPLPWPESKLLGTISLTEDQTTMMTDKLTASFLVIQHGEIIFEQYWRGHDKSTLSNSFSMAKSIVAMAVGLAVDDGLIEIKAPVAKYLPRFNEGLGADLTVEHLLQMRSNIPFGESYKNPFGFQAKAYYGDDILALLNPYLPTAKPGTVWYYQGGNTMLLAEIISKVQPLTLSEYVGKNIWTPMRAEADALWGLDAVDGTERCFAQFYATTRDFARFGKLILESGSYDGVKILSGDYISKMTSPTSDSELGISTPHYGYQTWLGHTDDGKEFSILEGLRGQYVVSVPELDLIMVRTGYQHSSDKVRFLSQDSYLYLAAAMDLVE